VGEERVIGMQAPVRRRAQPRPVRALVIPVSLSADAAGGQAVATDSSGALAGTLTVPLDHLPTAGGWQVTILAGDDTSSNTPAARLSRALQRARTQQTRLADRCRADAREENRAAARQDEPAPCEESSGLPLVPAGVVGDGTLVTLPDGRTRVEQRTQTGSGELTLWGSRISP
jgi:hypothetical protein